MLCHQCAPLPGFLVAAVKYIIMTWVDHLGVAARNTVYKLVYWSPVPFSFFSSFCCFRPPFPPTPYAPSPTRHLNFWWVKVRRGKINPRVRRVYSNSLNCGYHSTKFFSYWPDLVHGFCMHPDYTSLVHPSHENPPLTSASRRHRLNPFLVGINIELKK